MTSADKPEIGTEPTKTDHGSKAVVETSSTAVAAREKASVEARFVMAMNRPRDPEVARQKILNACRRPRFAESARYGKPVGDKKVYGLSVRFAEEVSRLWGNIFVQADVAFDDRERRIYNVIATDLETNTAQQQGVIIEKFVERRSVKVGEEIISSRTNTRGEKVYLKPATEDELLIKANAAISKTRRNLILTLIPADIREEAEEECINTSRDRDAKDPEGTRKRLLDAFFVLGVTADQVKALVGKPLEQLNPAEMEVLRQAYTALKEQEATWADIQTDPFFNRGGKKKADQSDGQEGKSLKQKVRAAVKKVKEQTDGDDEAAAIADVEAEEEARIRSEEQGELGN